MVRLTVQLLKIVTIVVVAVLIAVTGRWGFNYAMDRVKDPDLGKPVPFEVTADDTAETIAARLKDEGLINSEFYFTTQLQLASGELRPASYTLRHGMSVVEIIDRITDDGDTEEDRATEAAEMQNVPVEVTIIEGWRIEQMADEFAAAGLNGGRDAFIEAASFDYSDQFEFLADLPEGATLEGYLFPDTYQVNGNLGAQDAILHMLQRFDEQFSPDMRQRAAEMGLTIHQVVTLASIVEREVSIAEERPIVAAVYLNRLEAGMELGADPTVQYVLGTPEDWWPVLAPDAPTLPEADSPYNTYLYGGLPPGPICSPSKASIQAVLYPDENNYLYFVAKNDGSGEHVFAETLEEHEQNIATYLDGVTPTVAPTEGT